MDDSPWMPPGTDATGADPGDQAASPTPPAAVPPPAPAGVAPGLPTPTLPPAAPPPPPVVAAAPPPPPPPVPTLPTPQQVAPAPAAPAPAAFGAPAADPVAAPPFDVSQAAATPRRSGRSKVLVGTGIVGVLAVGAAGVFAVQSFGDEAQGGAATPDELGTSLMTAIENEDALGMIDVLLPGERDLLRQPAIDYVAELTRLEVLSSDADLAAIAGLDVVLENEDIAVEGTNVDDIVNIRMSADAEVTVDGAAFPIGDLVTDNMDQEMVDEMRSSTQTERELLDFRMAAVEQDGRWYFSLFHTAAEDVRDDEEPARDIPLEGVGARGAESPEAAVDQLLDSVEALDLELMIQTMNPGEAAALQRYAPMFLADAQAEIDDAPLEWEITTRELRVEGDGSQRTVFIDAIAIEGTADGEPFSVSVDGSCVRAEAAGETFDQCVSDATESEELDQLLDEAPQLREFLTALEEAFADMEPVGLELREYEGAWYVSPVSTLNEAVLAFLRALDRAEIDRLIELGQGAFDETLGGFGSLGDMALGSEDDPFVIDPGVDDDPVADTATDMSVATTLPMDDGMTVTGTASDTYVAPDWEACYSELDVAAAVVCFDQYVQSGEVDEYMVPIELRFPECGLESRWNRELYSMPDAEFIATIEAAAPCYQALVDAGTISEFEVPSEVFNLECYEGRNWYNTFDDPEYDDRYWACVDALYAQDTVSEDTTAG